MTGGPLVVLTGASPDAVDALGSRKQLVTAERFPVLVNGRKAQIVVAARA